MDSDQRQDIDVEEDRREDEIRSEEDEKRIREVAAVVREGAISLLPNN